ncbi:MAG TPA: DUF1508 domain-containing protein [Thermoanaerobaculia bacterium]|nr:DUF1508 domain-containing protein [Thermoanaerobaculia bacterium]
MSERLEISILEQSDGTWRLRVTADGRTLATGAEVASRDLAERQAAALREHAGHDGSFVRAESPDGRFFFNLLGDNRHVLATSERFASAAERDAAIADLERLAATAPVAAG